MYHKARRKVHDHTPLSAQNSAYPLPRLLLRGPRIEEKGVIGGKQWRGAVDDGADRR